MQREKTDNIDQKQYRQHEDQQNKNKKKTKMEISNVKQAKSLTKKLDKAKKRETLREKLNLFW